MLKEVLSDIYYEKNAPNFTVSKETKNVLCNITIEVVVCKIHYWNASILAMCHTECN